MSARTTTFILAGALVVQSAALIAITAMDIHGSKAWAKNYFQCAKISKGWEDLAKDRGDRLGLPPATP